MIVSVDAKALEWRVLTELAGDATALQEIIEGKDAHELNRVAFNLPSRLISKKYLFRTIYNRGKGYAFTVDPEFMHVSTSQKYWDEVGRKFYTKYAAIEELYKTNTKKVMAGEDIVGPLGRFWPIRMERNFRGDLVVPETLIVNHPTQGTGHDVMAIARVSFTNRLRRKEWGKWVKQIGTIHDSCMSDVPDELVQEVVNLYYQVFDDLPLNIKKLFNYDWQTPLGCEASAGPNMKDCVEIPRTDLS
jgi:DNA polymerase I-like protein with 3'-5' exonuclease and polymerase domains